jgi:hypothetical protein
MVGSRVSHHETFVADDAGQDGWLFDGPLADICPIFIALGVLLLGM